MNKLKLFVENFIVYGLGGVINKLIPLVMIPIITRLMPDSGYYGISDMANTVVSFGTAIAVMGMYDAMYRMFFEKDDEKYKKEICSTTLFFTFGLSIVVAILVILLRYPLATLCYDPKIARQYTYLMVIIAFSALASATNQIVSAPTRMQNFGIFFISAFLNARKFFKRIDSSCIKHPL